MTDEANEDVNVAYYEQRGMAEEKSKDGTTEERRSNGGNRRCGYPKTCITLINTMILDFA